MSGKSIVAALAVVALAWSGTVSAELLVTDPWTNLAFLSTASSNDTGTGFARLNARIFTGTNDRWHQSRVPTVSDPTWIAFDLGVGNSAWISYARMYNQTDPSGGRYSYHLEYCPVGMDPSVAANWVPLTETYRTNATTNPGDVFVFAPVEARALKWVLTEGTANNFRFSRFEFYSENQKNINLVNSVPGAQLVWTSDHPTHVGKTYSAANAHDGLPGHPRLDINSRTQGTQDAYPIYVTFTLPSDGDDYILDHLRLYSEDGSRSIGQLTIQYLAADGETWVSIPAYTNLGPGAGGSFIPNIADFDLSMIPPTKGLQLHITMPSTNASDNILRLWQFEVFGRPVPEPATMTLLALGGLAMLRRRK